jgi:hypothetical protein
LSVLQIQARKEAKSLTAKSFYTICQGHALIGQPKMPSLSDSLIGQKIQIIWLKSPPNKAYSQQKTFLDSTKIQTKDRQIQITLEKKTFLDSTKI